MSDTKKLNPAAIIALKEALAQIYWYKKDLRSFLINTLENSSMVAAMNDFSHLEYLDDGKEKATRARKAVEALRKYTSSYQKIWDEKQQTDERRTAYAEKLERVNYFRTQLDNLKKDFSQLVVSSDLQGRGYRLEAILKQLFELFDLDPKASFKIEGEQIDGAFTFDGADYLFEAKWQNEFVRANALDFLASKVQRKLDNTLGLFLSINGFSLDGISAHSSGRKVLLLMDGSDMMAVLDGRIELPELLKRKRRHAAQTGEIYMRYQDMLG